MASHAYNLAYMIYALKSHSYHILKNLIFDCEYMINIFMVFSVTDMDLRYCLFFFFFFFFFFIKPTNHFRSSR